MSVIPETAYVPPDALLGQTLLHNKLAVCEEGVAGASGQESGYMRVSQRHSVACVLRLHTPTLDGNE